MIYVFAWFALMTAGGIAVAILARNDPDHVPVVPNLWGCLIAFCGLVGIAATALVRLGMLIGSR